MAFHFTAKQFASKLVVPFAEKFKPSLDSVDEMMIDLQRQIAQPKSYRFEVRKVEKLAKGK